MSDFTYKDICLILQMGANGFGIDDISYNNEVQTIKLSRWENTGSGVTEAELVQTDDGLQISKMDLPEEELLEQEEIEADIKAKILADLGVDEDKDEDEDEDEDENKGPVSKIRPLKLAANLKLYKPEEEGKDESETSQG